MIRRLYMSIKLSTVTQESSFHLQNTQLFYTNYENKKCGAYIL